MKAYHTEEVIDNYKTKNYATGIEIDSNPSDGEDDFGYYDREQQNASKYADINLNVTPH